jgi:prolyl oligopeptidase
MPATPRHPVTDEYHGVRVVDDYRWLENGDDPEVRQWSEQQNRYTRATLDTIASRPRILERLREISRSASATYSALQSRGGALFALKAQPPAQRPYLVQMASPDDLHSERVVVDPNALDHSGTTAIDFYVPSLDGRLVAVSLSRSGTEEGTIHVYESATGRSLDDTIAHVNDATAAGSVAWNAAATGFYYTRYPRDGERPAADRDFYQQIYFHRLGTPPERDAYEIGKAFPRIAYTALQAADRGGDVLATVGNGFGGETAHYLRSPSGTWTSVTRFGNGASRGALGPDGALISYLMTAPREGRSFGSHSRALISLEPALSSRKAWPRSRSLSPRRRDSTCTTLWGGRRRSASSITRDDSEGRFP